MVFNFFTPNLPLILGSITQKIRSCQGHPLSYSWPLVRLNWKTLRMAIAAAGLLLGVGCSGINASKSISPLDFLLPGILKVDPPPAQPDGTSPAEQAKEIA